MSHVLLHLKTAQKKLPAFNLPPLKLALGFVLSTSLVFMAETSRRVWLTIAAARMLSCSFNN